MRQGDVSASLLQFEVQSIPPGTRIEKATLILYVANRSNSGHLTCTIHAVRRAWREHEATWMQAQSGQGWQVFGCNGSSDRDPSPLATLTLAKENDYYSVDLTSIVQAWVDEPRSNHGLVIKSGTGASVEYRIASRETRDEDQQPRLEVRYFGKVWLPMLIR